MFYLLKKEDCIIQGKQLAGEWTKNSSLILALSYWIQIFLLFMDLLNDI